jgi:RNA polymerase sigma factor (sigma-70 family)
VDDLGKLDEGMARLADGDRSAADVVFRALLPYIVRCCEKMLGRGADADDATQEALQKVFAQAHRYDRSRPSLPWALAIAAWECRTLRKRRQRSHTTPLESAPETSAAGANPEESVIVRDLMEVADTVLQGLSESDRETLMRAFAEEAEERLPIAGATLRKRRERAIRRLKQAWRKVYGP